MQLRLINDGILVKQNEADDVTEGGIVLPEAAKKKPKEGTVVAVGPGRQKRGWRSSQETWRPTVQVRVGDYVFFKSFAGTELTIDGQKYMVLEEADILIVKE